MLSVSACADDKELGEDKAAEACAALTDGDFGEAADKASEAADHDDKWRPLAEALATLEDAAADTSTPVGDAGAEAIVAAADECAGIDAPVLGP